MDGDAAKACWHLLAGEGGEGLRGDDLAWCLSVSFGDHIPYLRVLAPRKYVQGTVYLWVEGASLTC